MSFDDNIDASIRVEKILHLCECCALVVVNDDDTACRDYYGHTHVRADVAANTVVEIGDPQEHISGHYLLCDGHRQQIAAMATYYQARCRT